MKPIYFYLKWGDIQDNVKEGNDLIHLGLPSSGRNSEFPAWS